MRFSAVFLLVLFFHNSVCQWKECAKTVVLPHPLDGAENSPASVSIGNYVAIVGFPQARNNVGKMKNVAVCCFSRVLQESLMYWNTLQVQFCALMEVVHFNHGQKQGQDGRQLQLSLVKPKEIC